MPATSAPSAPSAPSATPGVAKQDKILESILQRLLFRDTFGIPKQCGVGDDIQSHLRKIDNYLTSCGIDNPEAQATILLNSISDDLQLELCGLIDFKDHEDDYGWLSGKLLELFQPKESELSPFIKLFSHKQRRNQTTREFRSEIRREGYKLLKDLDPKQRETHMISAFCDGLYNEDVKKALKYRKCETLDEAYNLIKKEKQFGGDEDGVARIVTSNKTQQQVSDFEKLQNQVSMIQKQLTYIVSILQADSTPQKVTSDNFRGKESYAQVTARHIPPQNRGQNVPFRRGTLNPIKCFCCGKHGHIARECNIRCRNCGQKGHTANRCFSREPRNNYGRRNVRLLNDADDNDWSDCETLSPPSSCVNENVEETMQQEAATLNMVHVDRTEQGEEGNMKRRSVTNNYRSRMAKKYPDEINQWADFIEGRTNKKPKTLISLNHSERAANKPVIEGQCQGHACKILCDSGAEVNVIDETFVQKMQVTDSTIRIATSQRSIKCANNSSMHVIGSTRLRMSFASTSKFCTFLVVKRLFPKVILGIRSMNLRSRSEDDDRSC